jgi:RNA polymerase sigma-70 factor (ECF subfamily)
VITYAWERIDQLDDPRALKAWLTRIAVFTARKTIRRRRRRRWLTLFAEVPEPVDGASYSWAGPDLQEAARCVYRILQGMPVDERIPFSLRMLEDLDLDATARACGVSLSTVRRRLARAERRFFKAARRYEALGPWLERG